MLMAEGAMVTVCHPMTRPVAMPSHRAEAAAIALVLGISDDRGNSRITGDTDRVRAAAGWPGGEAPCPA